MPTFRYRAYGLDGSFAEGTLDAASSDAATDVLWSKGLTPFQMRTAGEDETRWWNRELLSGSSARRGQLLAFTREFAVLNSAEIPLDDALRILREQTSSPGLRTLVESLLEDVLNGSPLSDAMHKQAGIFPAEYVAIVRAGEIGGTLAEVFVELAALLERRAEVRSRIQSALVYPCVLIVLSFVALAVVIGGLVPSIAPIFDQGATPMPASIKLMLAAHEQWVVILIATACAALAIAGAVLAAIRRPEVRLKLDRFKLRLPVLGSFLLQHETSRFARTLGTMLKAGVPIVQAATAAAAVIANRHLAVGMDRAIEALQQGSALHRALRKEAVLPPIALQMISIGEEAGKLDLMLMRVALMLERSIQASIDRFMSVLTPALTVAIAAMIGALILPVMSAVLSINELAAR